MFYAWNITLASGQSAASKTKYVLQLEKGMLVRTEIIFPTGCNNLVYCALNDALHQIYPTNPALSFQASGERIEVADEYPIQFEPYQLQFYGWNTDETYNHTITLRLMVIPRFQITRLSVAEAVRFTKLTKPI